MKTNFFKALLCTSLLVAFVGCGKDEGSKSIAKVGANPILSNNMNTVGAQAYNNALIWYNSSTEPTVSAGAKLEQRTIRTFSTPKCSTKTVLGFIDFQSCFGSSSYSQTYASRTVTPTATVKSSNTKLSPAFSPASGLQIHQVLQQGTIFSITYVNMTNGKVVQYKIDTALHSLFNPVEIYDSELARQEFVNNPTYLK